MPRKSREGREFELFKVATDLFHEERYDFAVIAAHTAVEVYMEIKLTKLIEWRKVGDLGDVILDDLLRSYSPADPRVRALWTTLTGDMLTKQEWWSDFQRHLTRRNEIVHHGHELDH